VILRLTTAPASEPVTLAEAKAHLRIEHTLDDTYIEVLIAAARQHVEAHCWRGLITQTWELVLEQFPDDTIGVVLPKGRVASITSVKYIDTDGVEQTCAADVYDLDNDSEPSRLLLAYDQDWPSTRDQWDAVRIRYVVGTDAANVPAAVKQAVLMLVSQMYEHRTPEVVGTIVSPVKFAVDALLAPHRLARF
jgi:uncharacterized phiE125 gp8 family phage protein